MLGLSLYQDVVSRITGFLQEPSEVIHLFLDRLGPGPRVGVCVHNIRVHTWLTIILLNSINTDAILLGEIISHQLHISELVVVEDVPFVVVFFASHGHIDVFHVDVGDDGDVLFHYLLEVVLGWGLGGGFDGD